MKKTTKTICMAAALSMMMIFGFNNVSAADSVKIDANNFPDQFLRDYVGCNCDLDKDGILSAQEMDSVQYIYLHRFGELDDEFREENEIFDKKYKAVNYEASDIKLDLNGIQYFTNLQNFEIDRAWGLKEVSGDRYNMYEINIDNMDKLAQCKKLQELIIGKCDIPSIDLSVWPELRKVTLSESKVLNSIHIDNPELTYFAVDHINSVESINLSKAPKLERVVIQAEKVKKVNVTGCSKLNNLYLASNTLKSISLKSNKNLKGLTLAGKKLSKIDLANNKKLVYVTIGGAKMKVLDLRKNTKLKCVDLKASPSIKKVRVNNVKKFKKNISCTKKTKIVK